MPITKPIVFDSLNESNHESLLVITIESQPFKEIGQFALTVPNNTQSDEGSGILVSGCFLGETGENESSSYIVDSCYILEQTSSLMWPKARKAQDCTCDTLKFSSH